MAMDLLIAQEIVEEEEKGTTQARAIRKAKGKRRKIKVA